MKPDREWEAEPTAFARGFDLKTSTLMCVFSVPKPESLAPEEPDTLQEGRGYLVEPETEASLGSTLEA